VVLVLVEAVILLEADVLVLAADLVAAHPLDDWLDFVEYAVVLMIVDLLY
jgi:hypothetical protein